MRNSSFWFWLFLVIIVILVFKIAGFAFFAVFRIVGLAVTFAARFWYITIPVILYFVWRGLPSDEKKNKKDDDVEDADFQVIKEDEEENK